MGKEFSSDGISAKLIKKLAEAALEASKRVGESVESLTERVDLISKKVNELSDRVEELEDNDCEDYISKEEFTDNLRNILDHLEIGYFESDPGSDCGNCLVIPIDDNYEDYLNECEDDYEDDDERDCDNCDDVDCPNNPRYDEDVDDVHIFRFDDEDYDEDEDGCDDEDCCGCCGCCDEPDAIDEIQAIADDYGLRYDIIGDGESGEALVVPIDDEFNVADCDKAYTLYEEVKRKCEKDKCNCDPDGFKGCDCCKDSNEECNCKGDKDCDNDCAEDALNSLATGILTLIKAIAESKVDSKKK